MSTHSRAVFTFSALLTLLLSSACFGQLNVVYTGRTLGYLRFPDKQAPDFAKCGTDFETAPADQKSTGAAKFYDELKSQRALGEWLTVGMGDNFGPDLYARTFDGDPPKTPKQQTIPHPGKDLFVWDGKQWIPDAEVTDKKTPGLYSTLLNHGTTIPADNVGCFIRTAGYDAIVPGTIDFEAGPEHLIAMARFLMDDHKNLPKTAMLGANLAFSTAMPEAKPRIPLYQIEHTFEGIEAQRKKDHLPSYQVVFPPQKNQPVPTPKLPVVVFPWLHEVDITNAFYMTEPGTTKVIHPADRTGKWKLASDATGAKFKGPFTRAKAGSHLVQDGADPIPVDIKSRVSKVQLCENAARDPYAFLKDERPNCHELDDNNEVDPEAHKTGTITYNLGKQSLLPDHNYAICVEFRRNLESNQQDVAFFCQPFYVVTPFFSSSTGTTSPIPEPDAEPFMLKKVNGETVAIFGLLDPDLQNRIGRLNYGWWNTSTQNETTVVVADPAASLKQALMRCAGVPACKNANRNVLLAQMPAAKAAQLLNSIKKPVFNLVVSQTDSSNKTGSVVVKRTTNADESPKYIVTPDDLYSEGKLTLNIQKAIVDATPSADAKTIDWKLQNLVKDKPVSIPIPAPGAGKPSLRDAAITTLKFLKVEGDFNYWNTTQILQRLALLVMQREQYGDLSMLQTRDLFEPQTYGPSAVTGTTLQELLDRIFWKNDFAVRIPVTGATLTAVLQASADFDTLDINPLNTDLEQGRSLVTLGVFKEAAEQNLTVNGAIVDPAKLYAVTLTDFLAVGDTGYTQLKTPAIPLPYRIKDFPHLHSISGMVCKAIAGANAIPLENCFTAELNAKDYLDPSNQQPPDKSPGFTVAQQTRAYLDLPLRHDRFNKFYVGQNAAEEKSAQKKYWSLSVEKGDFGINFSRHVQVFEGTQPQNKVLSYEFSGVQIATVTAPTAYTVTFDNRTRLKRSSQLFDFYIMDEMAYSYTRTQDATDNNFTRNLSLNSLSLETGFLVHLHERRRSPRQVDLLFAARGDTEVVSPREDIVIAAQTCTTLTNCVPTCPAGTVSSAINPCTPSCPPLVAGVPCTNPAGTDRQTLRRSADLYGKLGVRFSDTRSWFEAGILDGRSLQVPYALKLLNGQSAPNDMLFLQPGNTVSTTNCVTGVAGCNQPTNPWVQDWTRYLSYYGLITPSTQYKGIYQTRPMDGVFVNFSFNVPIPFGNRYADWAGGKGLAFLAENSGRMLFNHNHDLAAQTRYYDKLALSVIIPVIGNLSLKPEVDFTYYRNKASTVDLPAQYSSTAPSAASQTSFPFHSVSYLVTFSYTFDWRMGQSWRSLRYASPPPTSSVPTSGR